MDIIAHLATPLDIKVLLDVVKKTCAIISIRSLAGKIQCFQQNWPVISSRKVRKLQNVRKSTKICNPGQTFSSLLSKHKLQTGATRSCPNRQYNCHWICCRKIYTILFSGYSQINLILTVPISRSKQKLMLTDSDETSLVWLWSGSELIEVRDSSTE